MTSRINVVPADDDLVELQPCPFCGVGAVADETSVGAFVYCPNEECFIQPETGAFQDVADAVAKWNTRASLSSELARCRNAKTAETYALGLMVEEMGETLKLIGKSLRFGIDSPGPNNPEYGGRSARDMLPLEIGDLHAALRFAAMAGVFRMADANEAETAKLAKLLNPESRDNLGRRLAPALNPIGERE